MKLRRWGFPKSQPLWGWKKKKTENIALSETRPGKRKMFWWNNCNPCLLYACTRILIGGLFWCMIATFLLLHIHCLYSRTTSLHASMSLFVVMTAKKLWRGGIWTFTKNLNVMKGLQIVNIVMSSFLSTPLRYSVDENLYCDNWPAFSWFMKIEIYVRF